MDIKLSRHLIDSLEQLAGEKGISVRAYIKQTLQEAVQGHTGTISIESYAHDSQGVKDNVYTDNKAGGVDSSKDSCKH